MTPEVRRYAIKILTKKYIKIIKIKIYFDKMIFSETKRWWTYFMSSSIIVNVLKKNSI